MNTYCDTWPQALKDAEAKRFRAECKLRCLLSSLDRTEPTDFNLLMLQIEATQTELRSATYTKLRLLSEYENRPGVATPRRQK